MRAILPKNSVIDIQHVGCTAIPGLSAKPFIDIIVLAQQPDAEGEFVNKILALAEKNTN